MIKLKNIVNEMKVNKNDYTVDFSQEINDIQKSLNDTISKLKDLGKKLDGKATSQFPNYPKDAIHRSKPDIHFILRCFFGDKRRGCYAVPVLNTNIP